MPIARASLAAVLALASLCLVSAPAHAGLWSWIKAPFAWLASTPPPPECSDRLCQPIDQQQGWTRMDYGVGDHGTGVYLEVQGRVQFRSAELTLADGTVSRLDLQYITRSDGIFELKTFPGEQRVKNVQLLVRSVSPVATLAVRLSRDGV